MLWSSWWFHRAAINFEALPSSVGMEIFLNLVGCCNVDFEADIMLTYTQRDSNELFPSTKAFQKNPRQWMMVGTSAINKCGWTPNLKDNGNITLIISQTESSNVVYNSQISWLLVSTLVATKGCRCQHFLQWYWFAETTVCARYLAMATMHLAWGMQLQREIKASNVVEVCWPMIAPVYTNWHKKPAEQSTDIQHQIPVSQIFPTIFRNTSDLPRVPPTFGNDVFSTNFGMFLHVSTKVLDDKSSARGLNAVRVASDQNAHQGLGPWCCAINGDLLGAAKGPGLSSFPFFNGHLGVFPPFSDISTYWMFKNLWILIRKYGERVLVIVIQFP